MNTSRYPKNTRKFPPINQRVLMIFQLSLVSLHLLTCFPVSNSAQLQRRQKPFPQSSPPPPVLQQDNVVAEMQVVCMSDAIVLMVNTNNPFRGMIFAKDSPDIDGCVSKFHASTNMTLKLPLKSCGTLSTELPDGIEYFNTVVVQPHMRLMTNQGKGYHVKCKYQTRERTIANPRFDVSANFSMQNGLQSAVTPLLATASMPSCKMSIYRIGVEDKNVAESVRVGDKLRMAINIDPQDIYGMRVTNCVVRDGMNKAEQQLIDDQGCPVDPAIMPQFEYPNNTHAEVTFKAHKFPHTSSIYYQCNVRLCINNGACEPVLCNGDGSAPTGNNNADPLASSGSFPSATSIPAQPAASSAILGGARRKRFAAAHQQLEAGQQSAQTEASELKLKSQSRGSARGKQDDLSFDVYSGLYVSDISEMAESSAGDPNGQQVLPARRQENGLSEEVQDSCLAIGKALLLVVVSSFGSVTLVMLIACQAGLLGCSGSSAELQSRQAAPARSMGGAEMEYSPESSRGAVSRGAYYHYNPTAVAGRSCAKNGGGLSSLRLG